MSLAFESTVFRAARRDRLMRGFERHVSDPPLSHLRCPLQKYVRIAFIRKNYVRTPYRLRKK